MYVFCVAAVLACTVLSATGLVATKLQSSRWTLCMARRRVSDSTPPGAASFADKNDFKPAKKAARVSASTPVPERMRGKKNDKLNDVATLEKQVLAKYGSNEFKNALLEEEFDDDYKRPPSARSEGAGVVGTGRFQGFNPPNFKKEKQQMSSVSPAKEERKGLGLRTPKPTAAVMQGEEEEEEEIEDEDAYFNSLNSLSDLTARLGIDAEQKLSAGGDFPFAKKRLVAAESKPLSSLLGRIKLRRSKQDEEEEEEEEEGKEEASTDYEGVEGDAGESASKAAAAMVAPSGPLGLPGGFRLRPPQVPHAVREREAAAKRAEKEAKEEQGKKEKKKFDKTDFFEYEFNEEVRASFAGQLFGEATFEAIGVKNAKVLRNLENMAIATPTRIQEKAVPLMMEGKDVIMQAQTGSGKTIAFLLPLLNVINPDVKKVQAIIIAPSRELVTQIGLVASSLFQGSGIEVISLIGGANVKNQIERLRKDRPHIVVATPGRLAEIVFRLKKLRLGMVRAVVIDEIDNMLHEPYIGEIQTLLEGTPLFRRSGGAATGTSIFSRSDEDSGEIVDETEDEEEEEEEGEEGVLSGGRLNSRMVCLASATGNSEDVQLFAEKYSSPDGYTRVAVESSSMLPPTITHGLISCPRIKALELLKKFLVAKPAVKSALIFVNDPHRVEIICDKLLEMNMVAAPLHGDTSKEDRKEILTRVRDGRINLVVTTELAARGIDIPDLTHVINFELPTDAQHYVHRAGRCGRAGRQGLVMNFATPDTKFVIRRFGKQLRVKVMDCEIREGKVFLKSR